MIVVNAISRRVNNFVCGTKWAEHSVKWCENHLDNNHEINSNNPWIFDFNFHVLFDKHAHKERYLFIWVGHSPLCWFKWDFLETLLNRHNWNNIILYYIQNKSYKYMNTPLMSLSIQITLLAHHTHTYTYEHTQCTQTDNWAFENQNMPFSIRYAILCSNKNIELN